MTSLCQTNALNNFWFSFKYFYLPSLDHEHSCYFSRNVVVLRFSVVAAAALAPWQLYRLYRLLKI